MASKTTNYNMHKIDLADSPPDISVLGPNFDIIDTKLKELENGKVSNVAGKGLSTNDYTTAEKNKLASIAIATQAEAESGASDAKYMTPLKTKQAIQKLAPAPDLSGYATKEDVQTVSQTVTEHLEEQATQNQRLASEDLRLRQLNTNLQKEIAYLKLQQEASSRIENGTTFADDLNGNRFGMTFNEEESNNIVIRDGEMLLLESTQETKTITDATVVNQAYDTSGNGGRKLVRLDNGVLVSAVKTGTSIKFYKYVSGEWTEFYNYAPGTTNTVVDISIVAKTEDSIFMVASVSTSSTGISTSREVFLDGTVKNNFNVDTGQTAIGNVSLTINPQGTELHATWSSKNSSYPNSYNIRYAKGTINADGSVTWGAVEQVTKQNSTTTNITNPVITLDKNGSPYIITQSTFSTSDYRIQGYYGSNFAGVAQIYMGSSYIQSSPSSIFVPSSINGLPNGRIWVAWHGMGNGVNPSCDIYTSYSDDGGVTWSVVKKVTEGAKKGQFYPSITANKNNEVFITWYGMSPTSNKNYLRTVKHSDNVWGDIVDRTATESDTIYPSTLFDNTFSLSFTVPLTVYKVGTTSIGFYGTWTVGSETSVTEATAIYNLPSTDYVGAIVQKEGSVNVQAYINNVLMDSDLEDSEYLFTKELDTAAPIKLRLELSRANTTGGNNDKVTRILGGVA